VDGKDSKKGFDMQPDDALDPRACGGRRFVDKIAIVAGGGQGIGSATARRLGQAGAVVVADMVATSAERLCNELRAHGASASTFVGDLSKQETAQALMAYAKAQHRRIDVLVNIVGGTIWFQPFQYYTPEQIEAAVNKSFWPSLWRCWSVLPYMIEQRSGAIVNLATHAVASRYRVPYAASKGGVMALTTSLAKEVAQYGIRLNCMAPHSTDASDRVMPRTYAVQIPPTELPEEERAAEAAFRRELVAREIPLGRRGAQKSRQRPLRSWPPKTPPSSLARSCQWGAERRTPSNKV
jgi:dihydroxycyclohexadiene carboxylate dehydrogenase